MTLESIELMVFSGEVEKTEMRKYNITEGLASMLIAQPVLHKCSGPAAGASRASAGERGTANRGRGGKGGGCGEGGARGLLRRQDLPRTRSIAQQPRTCSPGWRQCERT